MQELEKIFKEIDTYSLEFVMFGGKSDAYISSKWVKDIIRKHMNDGWIPVEERLPEGKALACDKYGEIMIGYICGNANGGYDCEGDGYEMFNVLAWRPLPEPCRPERSEGE